MAQQDDDEPMIEMLFRNGTLTVAGILTSFSLGFLSQWANNPIVWTLVDLPTMVLLSLGIVLQIIALIRFIANDSLKRRIYDRATRIFTAGLSCTAAGVILAIVIDFIQIIV